MVDADHRNKAGEMTDADRRNKAREPDDGKPGARRGPGSRRYQ